MSERRYFEMSILMLPLKNSNPLINRIYLKDQSNHLIAEISVIKNQDKTCAEISVYIFIPRCRIFPELNMIVNSTGTQSNQLNSIE